MYSEAQLQVLTTLKTRHQTVYILAAQVLFVVVEIMQMVDVAY